MLVYGANLSLSFCPSSSHPHHHTNLFPVHIKGHVVPVHQTDREGHRFPPRLEQEVVKYWTG